MMLLPDIRDGDTPDWKIWVLSTWLIDFDDFLPDESRLTAPSRVPSLASQEKFETDVVIVGAGNRYEASSKAQNCLRGIGAD